MLGVTVCLDVVGGEVVILLEAAYQLAGSLLDSEEGNGLNALFLLGLAIELGVSLVLGGIAGYALGKNVDRLHGELAVVILSFLCLYQPGGSRPERHGRNPVGVRSAGAGFWIMAAGMFVRMQPAAALDS